VIDSIRRVIETAFEDRSGEVSHETRDAFTEFKRELNEGRVRAAESDNSSITGWRVNEWVKKGILLGFRISGIVDYSIDTHKPPWFHKGSYPVKHLTRRWRSHRPRRLNRSGWCLSRPWSNLHAADVHQRRCLGRFGNDGRFTRAHRQLRPDWLAVPYLGRVADRRCSRAGECHARHC